MKEGGAGGRILSLDAIRGYTVVAMLFVNGTLDPRYCWEPLTHSQWNGYTNADLGVPAFIFFMGAALVFSLERDRGRDLTNREIITKLARRSILLILIGWLMSGFPFGFEVFWTPARPGQPQTWRDAFGARLATLKLTGILPHFGFVYFTGGALYLYLRKPARLAAVTTLLFVIHGSLLSIFSPKPFVTENNLQFNIDRALLRSHGMPVDETDPDGLWAMFGSVSTVLVGMLAGMFLKTNFSSSIKSLRLLLFGAAAVAAAYMLDVAFPINKTLWTPTFNIVAVGWTCIALSIAIFIIDVRGVTAVAAPFVSLGRRSLEAFILIELIVLLFVYIRVPVADGVTISLSTYLFENTLTFISNPYVRSHAGGAVLAVTVGAALLLYDRVRRPESKTERAG